VQRRYRREHEPHEDGALHGPTGQGHHDGGVAV